MSSHLAERVIRWFLANHRKLPWRETSDPYKIWVSEVMLQQTTVATVIDYYKRFLDLFPSLVVLGSADEAEVLKAWQGLGYYRRAKNLRAGAQFVIEKFSGQLPKTLSELLEIPGIGRYSAGAILSIAHRIPTVALDGNLIRIYSRHEGVSDPVDDSATLKRLWQIAESHVPSDSSVAREFTEGMMELGALVCTPRNPKCGNCPLKSSCRAFSDGLTEILPRKSKSLARKKLVEIVYWSEKNGKVAVCSKGSDPKYPDFMRLPFKPGDGASKPKTFLKKLKYAVTDRDFEVYLVKGNQKHSGVRWISLDRFDDVLLPTIDRKIIRLMKGE